MTLRGLVLGVFTTAVLLVSVIGWYALDFSLGVSSLLPTPSSVPATLMVLWGLCVALLTVLMVGLMIFFVRPLARLRSAALKVAAGNYWIHVDRGFSAEIGDLQDAFNHMVAGLASRAEADEDRRRAEQRYRTVFENANIGIAQARLDGTLEAVNPAYAYLLGYMPAELVGRSWMDITHPDDFTLQISHHSALVEGLVPTYRLEKRYLHKDGSEVWADVTVTAVDGAGGEGHLIITAQDITARIRAEAAQERYAADLAIFREMVNQSNDVFLVVDVTGQFLDVNDSACRQLGHDREELLALNIKDVAVGLTDERLLQRMAAARAQGGLVFEMVNRRKDGTCFPVEVSLRMVDIAGRTLGVAVVRDVTERTRIEAEQRAHLTLFQNLIEAIPVPVFYKDDDGVYLGCNKHFLDFVGRGQEEVVGKTVHDLAPCDLANPYEAADAELMRSDKPQVYEMQVAYADGSRHDVSFHKAPFTRPDGSRGLVGVMLDITVLKAAEKELRNREEHLRLLLEATEEGIFAVDMDGAITLCNPATVRMLGYASPSELIGRESHPLMHHTRPDGTPYPDEECPLGQALTERRISHVGGEVYWRRDGSSFPVVYAIYPIIRGDSVIGAVVSFSDVSHKLQAEAALRHGQKMEALGSLTGGIAHEINNLLLPILTLAGMTLKDLPEGSRARLRLEKIADAAGRAKDLVARMSAFANCDGAGKRELLDVGSIMARALSIIRSTVPATIDLVEDAGDGRAVAMVDASAIETVIVNLVTNAIDAVAGKIGQLTVSVCRVEANEALRQTVPDLADGRYVRLSVEDSGRGMDAATRKRMFDPFFTTKEVGTGTGLGLAVVHGVVAAHGGSIAVTSAPGQGTRIDIYLPAV